MEFQYSYEPHERRHGPQGYQDYRSYKPWLRDEFTFRCVYCLWRENWCAGGDDSFSVEHLQPRSKQPEQSTEYENLVYACCRCNSMKQDAEAVLDPCVEGWARHLEVADDGTVIAVTPDGDRAIDICRLNRVELVRARQRLRRLLETLAACDNETARQLLRDYRGFPDNLPQLSKLKPPGGNTRPEGIAHSYFEQRQRGELPTAY